MCKAGAGLPYPELRRGKVGSAVSRAYVFIQAGAVHRYNSRDFVGFPRICALSLSLSLSLSNKKEERKAALKRTRSSSNPRERGTPTSTSRNALECCLPGQKALYWWAQRRAWSAGMGGARRGAARSGAAERAPARSCTQLTLQNHTHAPRSIVNAYLHDLFGAGDIAGLVDPPCRELGYISFEWLFP